MGPVVMDLQKVGIKDHTQQHHLVHVAHHIAEAKKKVNKHSQVNISREKQRKRNAEVIPGCTYTTTVEF